MNRPSILLVDDKPENLLVLKKTLEDPAYDIELASSANEALGLLLDREFAVVLLDVQMPEIDGFETASLIHGNQRTQHVPIIFVTAINRDEAHVRHGYEVGAVDYLLKPIDPDTVRSKVSVFIKLYEQRQQLRTKAMELEQFAYIASHDLREPLRTIGTYLNLLRKRYRTRLDAEADELIHFAVDGASRMQSLINDLLEYSRAGRKNKELTRVDSEEVLAGALRNLSEAIATSRAVVTSSPLPEVLGERGQLEQVFQNLIANGIKYCKQSPPRVHISAERHGDRWHFRFRDNGIGILPEDQEKIFIVFHRLHTREEFAGTGIGLAICKRIIERHGGRIWVESRPEHGATFQFLLPAVSAESCH